jgi:phosphoglycerate dehydrogenase-like enzyme
LIIVLDEWYRSDADGRFSGCDVRYVQSAVATEADFLAAIREADVLGLRRSFTFPFGRDLIAQLPRLQFIQKSGSGADWFDVDALSEQGVLLAMNSGFNASSVAEHTVMLILTALRNAFGHMTRLRAGIWQRDNPGPAPMLLESKTVGIVGMGAIGGRVARAMLAFDARVIAYQRGPLPDWAVAAAIEAVALDDLMSRADIVTLHTPATPETNGLIDAARIARMKSSAILVNTARGAVVDERALYEALRDGRIRGAALDVFAREPTPADNPLLALENVIATPHVAGATHEMGARQSEGTLANIERFAAGLLPERLLNPEVFDSGRARASHLRSG